jgi:Cu/Ag efflux protein CusF
MKTLTLLGLLAISTLASAQNMSMAPEATAAPTATSAAAPEMTVAEVRKVDVSAGKVTLRHGEIKNLGMPPMTMVFQVSDPSFLSRVKAGDRVNFTADKVKGAYTVLTLEIIQ